VTPHIARIGDHGGGLARAEARFGAGDDWLDLSTGINPWPYPVPEIAPVSWQRLPDEDALASLKSAARAFYGAGPNVPIVAAPGSQALIQLVPHLMPPGDVAVIGPSYAEHARCWRLAGHSVTETSELDRATAPIVVVVNPNNPDGRSWAPQTLIKAARRRVQQGGLVVVDEAFAEVTPQISLAASAGVPGLVVLRSFGKFFGLAGLRLGFALGPADLVDRIEDAFGPWAVSGPGLTIGAAALADTGWAMSTRARLTAQARELDRVLARHGLEVEGGTDLYRLVRTVNAGHLFERLGRAHILVRAFSFRPDWLRFGLPPNAEALERLEKCLSA
jgi:cobalamin biosynthesis protein CobC